MIWPFSRFVTKRLDRIEFEQGLSCIRLKTIESTLVMILAKLDEMHSLSLDDASNKPKTENIYHNLAKLHPLPKTTKPKRKYTKKKKAGK